MIAEERTSDIVKDEDGNYRIIRNSSPPPTPISGNFFKRGHVFQVLLNVTLIRLISHCWILELEISISGYNRWLPFILPNEFR
jgi:hypothetical protein